MNIRITFLIVSLALAALPVSSARASGHGDGGHGGGAHGGGGHGAAEEESKGEVNLHIFDLGSFELREVQTTRKKTTEINFTAYFATAPEITKQQYQRLEAWKHRLRDQVIIAVRTAKNPDFQEPDLERLRRIIMFRVRRLLQEDLVKDVLISEFRFKTE